MKYQIAFIFCVTWFAKEIFAPPVTQSTTKSPNDVDNNEGQNELNVEYDRYLKEVVQALESDAEFREKLQKAEDADIRSGKIAHELEFVNHAVRSRLDEVKRSEMERLRKYARKANDIQQGLDTEHLGIHSAPDEEHLDNTNPDTFEIEDLRKLIAKTTKDLAEADQKRREEFKEYEMQKEFEKHEAMKQMNEEEKKNAESKNHELEEKHKKHAPLHHPISKPQLEEVWEKSDHMENQEFDPKTFFHLHDLNGDRVWDFDEVKALFLKELDKMYEAGAPEDDMRERVEEMERMREHVFQEADTNRDGLISYEEFLAQTQKKDFNSDPGWETLDQQQAFTPEEYHKFEMQRQQEIQQMIADGRLPQHFQPPGYPAQGQHLQYQGHPQQGQLQYQVPPHGHPQQVQAPHQGHPPQQFQAPPQGQPQQFQAPPQGHPQQFQAPPQGHPQQFQALPQGHQQQFQAPRQGQPQQFQAPPQGQPQQFQAPPQGQPQQFQAPPQGQPQQFQAPPQGHPQQFQAPSQGHPQQFQPVPPQPMQNPPPQNRGSSENHIASQQAASLHQSGQPQQVPNSPQVPQSNNIQGQPNLGVKQI